MRVKTLTKEYEETIKGIMKAARVADHASISVQSLEDKIRFLRLRDTLKQALSMLRRHIYVYEDAVTIDVRYCQECGNIETECGR